MTIHLLSPGDPAQRTGGYLYNARVVDQWRASGRDVQIHRLDARWPLPDDPPSLPELTPGPVVADGLLWTGLGAARRVLRGRRVTVVVHLALHLAGGITDVERERRKALEASALEEADAVVVTGRPTLDAIGRPAVLIVPGVDPAPPTVGPAHRILSVGTVTPRKGYLDLVRILERVDGPWRWEIAGSLERDPVEVERLRAAIEERGWAGRVRLWGELDHVALGALYHRCGTLLHGAHHEPYGMAIQEALVRRLFVVSRPAGALLEAPRGMVARYASIAEGARALERRLRERRTTGEPRFPSWAETASRLLEVVEGGGAGRSSAEECP